MSEDSDEAARARRKAQLIIPVVDLREALAGEPAAAVFAGEGEKAAEKAPAEAAASGAGGADDARKSDVGRDARRAKGGNWLFPFMLGALFGASAFYAVLWWRALI
ncbi:MAG: hypothetical protein ACOYJQ_05030 [Pseudochelatococcus sp.]|uniref:hypothetical protein n=1 Tax=Pseudochelatococcus sp. TaxID=2020869 RepID=UPI003D923658